jgi:hypothetical protein
VQDGQYVEVAVTHAPSIGYGGGCDDTLSHACHVANSVTVDVCVYGLVLVFVGFVFWRFRWWPMSRLRERLERRDAEVDALVADRHAREAGAPPPSEDELWDHFTPDD